MASFPSSYIPTTTASATRAADVLTVSSPGVSYPLGMFAEFEPSSLAAVTQVAFALDSGSGYDEAYLWLSNAAVVRLLSETGPTSQANETVGAAVVVGTAYKAAGRVVADNFKLARSGSLSLGDTSGTAPATPTRLMFGNRLGNSNLLEGYLRRAAIINFAPSDAQLQAMTT